MISKTSSTKNVNSLTRGLELLLLLNRQGPCQVRDLYRLTGMPKPTIVRMLATLRESGYVTQNADNSYRVTAKTLALAMGFNTADELLAVARPLIEAFREEHAWPCDLAIFDRDAMVIMETSQLPGTLSLNRGIGTRLPLTPTALGRAYLAFCPDSELEEILTRLRSSGDPAESLMKEEPRLHAILQSAHQRGYAVSDEGFQKKARILAAPVMAGNRVLACVNVMVIASAMTMEQTESAFAPALRELAGRIAAGIHR